MRRLHVSLGALCAVALATGAQAQSFGDDTTLFRGLGLIEAPEAVAQAPAVVQRYAVVVGNNTYEDIPSLANAGSDAKAMAGFLREQGFRVFEGYDLDKRGFEDLLRRVLFALDPESEVLFYYAGHGIQIGRRNYLLPTDAALESAYDTPFETVTLESLVAILAARSRMQLVILDSCRENPFSGMAMMTDLDTTLFEAREGFNSMTAPFNTFLAYSTSPGAIAVDGADGNSPFTSAFIEQARLTPDQSISEILSRVRREVYDMTAGLQVPWDSSTLVEPFFFEPEEKGPVEAASVNVQPEQLAQLVGVVSSRNVNGQVSLTGPLERRVALGRGILESLGAGFTGPLSVSADQLESGRLVLGTVPEQDYTGQELPATALASLFYEYLPGQRPARGDIEDFTVSEQVTVTSESTGTVAIELSLAANQCDFQAGDWLDPEGIGIVRYPNELEPEAIVTACEAAIAESPGTGRFYYQLGRGLQAQTKFDEARAAFERARDLRHTRAWHALGDLVAEADSIKGGRSEEGVPKEALEFYAQGVQEGDPYAFHALGKQFLRHGETEDVRNHGFALLSRALELGHTFAMNELGYYYLNENSEHSEPKRGLRYLRESAARNDIYGFHNLGLVYERGLGGEAVSPGEALAWYQKAAMGGHPFAPVNIGRLYFNGAEGVPADPLQAIRWYDEGLERGVAWGGANAAWIIQNQPPKGYQSADAAVRAAKAAVLRDEEAVKAARDVLASIGPKDMDRAAQMLLGDLGEDVTVDGVIGNQTRAAIDRITAEHGITIDSSAPADRLLGLARAYWSTKKFRVDLY